MNFELLRSDYHTRRDYTVCHGRCKNNENYHNNDKYFLSAKSIILILLRDILLA